MQRIRFVLFLLAMLASGRLATCHAADVGPTVALFNGENLIGWHAIHCEAAVEDGVLVITGGNGLLRADHRYSDFVLELDWRPRLGEKFDSGIYFRCEAPGEGKLFPDRYQINLQQGDEGNLIGFPKARSKGLVKAGEWNHVKLRVEGASAELEINGQPAWKTDGIDVAEGYLGIQVEVPGGGQYEFKNIAVAEIGYRSLFNGQDLAGWKGADKDANACWSVDNEAIFCDGKPGPWLRSDEQVDDFNLRLEYKLDAGGNSGVFVRVPEAGTHHGADAGVEIQVLDDSDPRYKELKPYQFSGSVYSIVAAEPHVSLPAGSWNTLEIDCRGSAYKVVHNGTTVVDADEKTAPELNERRLKGYLGLQNHSEKVWYRNLRIGPPQ